MYYVILCFFLIVSYNDLTLFVCSSKILYLFSWTFNVNLFGNLTFKKNKTSLTIIEENEIPVIRMKDYYLQEIIFNNDTIIRAYINVYYWLNNPLYDNNIRNLGYYSNLQSQITNLFKATIIDFIIQRLNTIHNNTHSDEINNVLIEFLKKK